MISTVAPYLLPIALPEAIKALPNTALHLIENLTDRLLERMGEGALDAAVIATDPKNDKLRSVDLCEEPFYFVSAKLPRPQRRDTIGVDEIDAGSLLLLAEGHCLRDQALVLCGAAEKAAGADVRATSLETLRHLADVGQGATVAPLLALAGWRRQSDRLARASAMILSARGSTRTARPSRTNRRRPSSASSFRIWPLRVGWLTLQAAARPKWPQSATATT